MQDATPSPDFQNARIVIDWPFNAPQPALKCPLTGMDIALGVEEADDEAPCEDIDYESIPTVLFAFLGDISEFLYIRPDLKQKLDAQRAALVMSNEEANEWDDFELLKSSTGMLGNVPVIFEVNTGGMACGPVWSTLWVGLDLFVPFTDA